MITEIIKNKFTAILSLITVTIILSIFYYNTSFGIDSIFDEGYLLLSLSNNSYIDISHWKSLIEIILWNSSIGLQKLKIIKLIIQLFSTILFASACFRWFKINYSLNSIIDRFFIFFLILFFFLPSFYIYTSIVSYNHIQQFFIFCALSLYLFYQSTSKNEYKNLFLFLLGASILGSIINLISSGLMLFFVLIIFLSFEEKSFKTKSKNIIYLLSGLFIASVFYSFFIINLLEWIENLYKSISLLGRANRGYDKKSMLIGIFKYLIFFFKSVAILISVYYILNRTLKNKKLITSLFFIISTLTIKIVTKEFNYTYYAIPVFFLGLIYIKMKLPFSFKQLFILISLLFFPLLFSIGTNTSLNTKSIYFIPIWGFILMILYVKLQPETFIKNSILIYLCVISIWNTFNWIEISRETNGNFTTSIYYFEESNTISKIGIRREQLNYFKKAQSILKNYNYNKNDYFLSFQLDHMTIYALNGKMSGLYFDPNDFVLNKDKFKNPTPKFLFLTKYDYQVIVNSLKSSNWNFPESYDKIYIGSPETFKPGYPLERWLYCKKINK